jgi:two-component system OmpR family sensor kinase
MRAMALSLPDRWNEVSLRTKITGVTTLLLTMGLLVTGVGTMTMLKPALIGQLDAQIQVMSADISRVVNASDDSSGLSQAPNEYYYVVLDATGSRLEENWLDKSLNVRPVVPASLTLSKTQELSGSVFDMMSRDSRVRYHAVAVPVKFANSSESFGTVVVALATTGVDRLMATYLSIFLGFGIGVVIIGALLTRLLVTTTFSPLRRVEKTAAAIADGDFSQRLPWSTPNTEVGRVTRALNTMLGRIDRAFADRARTIDQMRRFVGDASHELRTPLVSVRGYAELYRMGALKNKKDVAQAMDRIEREAIRMGILVDDLLALARLDEARPLELADIDLVVLAADAALDARAFDPDREVTVLTIDSAETPTALVITAEDNKIRQVITNLMGNALRFTDPGSPLEIAVGRDESGNGLIDVIDHGDGIPPQVREKIFERFWRADSSRARETGGSGLGLAIVASIVAAHEGSITVDETPGGGATFRVCLPANGPTNSPDVLGL